MRRKETGELSGATLILTHSKGNSQHMKATVHGTGENSCKLSYNKGLRSRVSHVHIYRKRNASNSS